MFFSFNALEQTADALRHFLPHQPQAVGLCVSFVRLCLLLASGFALDVVEHVGYPSRHVDVGFQRVAFAYVGFLTHAGGVGMRGAESVGQPTEKSLFAFFNFVGPLHVDHLARYGRIVYRHLVLARAQVGNALLQRTARVVLVHDGQEHLHAFALFVDQGLQRVETGMLYGVRLQRIEAVNGSLYAVYGGCIGAVGFLSAHAYGLCAVFGFQQPAHQPVGSLPVAGHLCFHFRHAGHRLRLPVEIVEHARQYTDQQHITTSDFKRGADFHRK